MRGMSVIGIVISMALVLMLMLVYLRGSFPGGGDGVKGPTVAIEQAHDRAEQVNRLQQQRTADLDAAVQ